MNNFMTLKNLIANKLMFYINPVH